MRHAYTSILFALAVSGAQAAQPGADAAARLRLQQRQLEDSLRLRSQQTLPDRSRLSPSDAQKLDELQLRQRAQQQLLTEEQLRLDRQRALRPGDSGIALRQRLLEQESELQLQRFRIEQEEALRSAKPLPLQR